MDWLGAETLIRASAFLGVFALLAATEILDQFRDQRKLSLPRLLVLPFTVDPGAVPINRH